MNQFRKLFVGSLAIVLVATSVMTFAAQSSHAAAGDNPRCECMHTAGNAATVGTWTPRVDDGAGGRADGSTVCADTGLAALSCNPLTDTFVSPGFKVPKLGDFLGNMIRFFFFIAGIVALVFLLIGAFKWVTSEGKEEGVKEAREQIQAAILGLIVMVAVLTLVVVVEQVIFGGKLCLGISCPLQLGSFNLVK
ncbi:MAG: hypothetical protein WCO78_01575 [Candidatus Roizmanbacteria bacterium]